MALTQPKRLALGWPRPCLLCGQWQGQALCQHCVARFAPLLPRCPQCALVSPSGLRCGACLSTAPAFSHCVAVADYGFPWDRLITAFKFHDQTSLAAGLAGLLDRAIQARCDLPAPELVLPVPLAPARLRERGYNQAWELARRLARRPGVAHRADLLLRLQDSAHQVGATREQRQHNLRHALWVDPPEAAALQGRQVALVDDVMTTGATAQAAAQALLQAGAAGVQVWLLARTPEPDALARAISARHDPVGPA